VGGLRLKNHIAMAPMTRSRSGDVGVPPDVAADCYASASESDGPRLNDRVAGKSSRAAVGREACSRDRDWKTKDQL